MADTTQSRGPHSAVAETLEQSERLEATLRAAAITEKWNLVFPSSLGTPLDARNVLRRFQKMLETAELPKMRIHDLRHSAASILIAQGVSSKATSELLGHSAVAFTLQVYGHLMEDTRREVASRMNDALSPVATTVATKTGLGRVN